MSPNEHGCTLFVDVVDPTHPTTLQRPLSLLLLALHVRVAPLYPQRCTAIFQDNAVQRRLGSRRMRVGGKVDKTTTQGAGCATAVGKQLHVVHLMRRGEERRQSSWTSDTSEMPSDERLCLGNVATPSWVHTWLPAEVPHHHFNQAPAPFSSDTLLLQGVRTCAEAGLPALFSLEGQLVCRL